MARLSDPGSSNSSSKKSKLELQQEPRPLSLPSEIRVKVYRLVFTGSMVWVGESARFRLNPPRNRSGAEPEGRRLTPSSHVNLLLTCKTTYLEALSLWYDATTFDCGLLKSRCSLDNVFSDGKTHVTEKVRYFLRVPLVKQGYPVDWTIFKKLEKVQFRCQLGGFDTLTGNIQVTGEGATKNWIDTCKLVWDKDLSNRANSLVAIESVTIAWFDSCTPFHKDGSMSTEPSLMVSISITIL